MESKFKNLGFSGVVLIALQLLGAIGIILLPGFLIYKLVKWLVD